MLPFNVHSPPKEMQRLVQGLPIMVLAAPWGPDTVSRGSCPKFEPLMKFHFLLVPLLIISDPHGATGPIRGAWGAPKPSVALLLRGAFRYRSTKLYGNLSYYQ